MAHYSLPVINIHFRQARGSFHGFSSSPSRSRRGYISKFMSKNIPYSAKISLRTLQNSYLPLNQSYGYPLSILLLPLKVKLMLPIALEVEDTFIQRLDCFIYIVFHCLFTVLRIVHIVGKYNLKCKGLALLLKDLHCSESNYIMDGIKIVIEIYKKGYLQWLDLFS